MRIKPLTTVFVIFVLGAVSGFIVNQMLQSGATERPAAPSPIVMPALTEAVSASGSPTTEQETLQQARSQTVALPHFSDVAEQTVQAVTNISSRQVVRQRSPFDNDRFFRYFFGDVPGMSGYREQPSLGSGVIVAADGYILTNAHVVGRNSRGVTVTLSDEREYDAALVGRDESTDIALLRIDATDLPTVPWGDSSQLRIAQWVLAVGNPFQLGQTVTLGIVSAVGRDNLGVARYEDFIQTDAAINPGN